jgi:hypothetical protein
VRRDASRVLDQIAWLAVAGGVIVTVAAIIWWAVFYGEVIGEGTQASFSHAMSCLYSRTGVCGFIPSVARASGKMAYSPSLFWFGLCLLLSGIAMRLLLARRG